MSVEIGRFRTIVIAAGGVAAVLGLYWDDAWHTDVGRDTFFSPPHLLLYAGVAALLAVVATWAWRRFRAEGWAILRDPALVLPLFGAAVTLASAPVDELWHQLFGRDAVVWSPPHMVIVAGLIAFAAGVLLAVRRSGDRWSQVTAVVIGAFLIAAVGAVVMEFEADVPQFPVVWYLPVVIAGLSFAFGLIRRASSHPWATTHAAGVYVALRIGAVGFLAALGHSLPTVMPTVAAAWAFDLALRRGGSRRLVAAATTIATVGTYVVGHAVQPAGLTLTVADAAVGVIVGFVASWAVLSAVGVGRAGRKARPVRVATATGAAVLVLLVVFPADPAFAHDPGQGEEVAPVVLEATRRDGRVEIQLAATAGVCADWEPVRVVARRAGRTPSGPLSPVGGCRFAGAVDVDEPGRWFVYAEFTMGGRLTEAWLPVEDDSHSKDTVLYVVSGDGVHPTQVAAGVLLYLIAFAILGAVVVACRRAAPQPPAGAAACVRSGR